MNTNLKIGSVVKFNSLKTTGFPNTDLEDITVGREYVIAGVDKIEGVYFIDDVGDIDFAAASDVHTLDMTVVSY